MPGQADGGSEGSKYQGRTLEEVKDLIAYERNQQSVKMGVAFFLSATATAYVVIRVILAGASLCVTFPR